MQTESINHSVEMIEAGLRSLMDQTQAGNENLIKRSRIFLGLEALIHNLKGQTQRRLTGKLQPDPDTHVDELFRRFNVIIGRIK